MQEKIERDLKTALLAGDKKKVETLKGLKNALQYELVDLGQREKGLTDEQAQKVLARESKKRQDAVELYKKVGEGEREESELYEKQIIDSYLPKQLPEEEVNKIVQDEVSKLDSPTQKDMGRVIGQVRGRLGAQADGATIARLVKQALEQKS